MFKTLSTGDLGVTGRQSEIIELALSFGFQGIDLNMEEFAEQAEAYGLAHARRLLDSAAIQVAYFRLPLIWDEWQEDETDYKQGLERLSTIARMAQDIGCSRCVSTIRPASDERPYHENFEFHRRRLVEIAEVLRHHGITLGLEFLAPIKLRKARAFQFIHTLDALVQLAKAAASDKVGVVVDLWHLHVAAGDLRPLEAFDANRIVAVYVSDISAEVASEEIDESFRTMPGETGVIHAGAAIARLAEMGFNGPVSVKLGRPVGHGRKRESTVEMARDRLNAIWKAAGLDSTGNVSAACSS